MKPASKISVGVIVATYNKPDYLRVTLGQLMRQDLMPDQIIIADDGSGAETKAVVEVFSQHHQSMVHVWHEDAGFRKCQILNKAIAQSDSQYLIFIDDDCLCPPWFVSAHLSTARTNSFTVGASVNLGPAITDNILKGTADFSGFLACTPLEKMTYIETKSRGGYSKLFLRAALTGKRLGKVFDRLYAGRGVFRGGNSGAWKNDLIKVNGFNNEMVYGHEDREIGERLRNLGLSCRQVRYFGANFHLHHDRSYADPERKRAQSRMCKQARKNGTTFVSQGIIDALD